MFFATPIVIDKKTLSLWQITEKYDIKKGTAVRRRCSYKEK